MQVSRDLFFVKTASSCNDITDMAKDLIVPLKRADIRLALLDFLAAKVPGADVNDRDLSWIVVRAPEWAIEFALGNEETVSFFTVFLHGAQEPAELLRYLAERFQAKWIDVTTGTLWTPANARSPRKLPKGPPQA